MGFGGEVWREEAGVEFKGRGRGGTGRGGAGPGLLTRPRPATQSPWAPGLQGVPSSTRPKL